MRLRLLAKRLAFAVWPKLGLRLIAAVHLTPNGFETDLRLARAKLKLDRLALYPNPVDIAWVRVIVSPRAFRLLWVRQFDGFALSRRTILIRPGYEEDDQLLLHELCHVWQMQHHRFKMPLSYIRHGYAMNPYEVEARQAVVATQVPGLR